MQNYFNRKSVEVQPCTPLEIMLRVLFINNMVIRMLYMNGTRKTVMPHWIWLYLPPLPQSFCVALILCTPQGSTDPKCHFSLWGGGPKEDDLLMGGGVQANLASPLPSSSDWLHLGSFWWVLVQWTHRILNINEFCGWTLHLRHLRSQQNLNTGHVRKRKTKQNKKHCIENIYIYLYWSKIVIAKFIQKKEIIVNLIPMPLWVRPYPSIEKWNNPSANF